MKLRAAARGSRLSRIQVETVANLLSPYSVELEFVEVTTKADLFSNEPIQKLGTGIFEKEVNQMVVKGDADMAIHSMKDLQWTLPPGLEVSAVLPRDIPFDSVIGVTSLNQLTEGSVVGTSSLRRENFMRNLVKEVSFKILRGNVDTRLRKMEAGEYDAIILAEASLRRLGIDPPRVTLDAYQMTPAVNQGIIAVVSKTGSKVSELLFLIDHKDTREAALAERYASLQIGLGCTLPLGIYFEKRNGKLFGVGGYATQEKKISVVEEGSDPKSVGTSLGLRLLEALRSEGINVQTR